MDRKSHAGMDRTRVSDAGASAGKNQVRPASQGSVRMSECDFQSQLRAPLKAVGTYHYVHLDGAPPLARPRKPLQRCRNPASIAERCNARSEGRFYSRSKPSPPSHHRRRTAAALAHRTGPGVAGPERCARKRIGSAKDRRSVDDMLERVRRDNQIADLALSRRKQGFESPRERQ